jgi:tRNA pseudouridine38-40 synthase
MPRYRITLEYDGTTFTGWQSQPDGKAVQDAVTRALLKMSGERVIVRAAGRTDAGVHAMGQVAHFELSKDWEAFRIREALNYHLRPAPAAVLECAEVDATFDARFSATARHYMYRILTRRAPPVLDRNRVWPLFASLDADAMHDAAGYLEGHHDFTTFRAAACQANSPMRTLDRLDVSRVGEEIHIYASARSFLHNQVRSMVGSLKLVGEGKWQPRDMQRALQAVDRSACGPVAPPQGLYLTKVDYGEAGACSPEQIDGDSTEE